MTLQPQRVERLRYLARVVGKQCAHLSGTDQRLFAGGFALDQAKRLETDPQLAERVEAFVARFGRLQDTLGDKLLPLLLNALGEKSTVAVDNLDRAERLGIIDSTEDWMAMRQLRNQMVH